MSKFGKSPYYQTAIDRHREMFREDCAKLVERTKWVEANTAPKPKIEGTIQGMAY